jgi:poly(U)-specific endoribonuclease
MITANTMDAKVEAFYRHVYEDLTVSPDEAEQLEDYFRTLNPPPDKLVWLRATAFRLACDFLSDDDRDGNVALLRAINAIVHSLESTCMVPGSDGNSEYSDDAMEEFLKKVYADADVDQEENVELVEYFREHVPAVEHLVSMRALIFKTACDFLQDDKEANTQLLRCVNVVVHNYEQTVFR